MNLHVAEAHLQKDGRVFVSTYSKDKGGFWVADGLPSVLPSVHEVALGSAVIDALKASTFKVLPATDSRLPSDGPFLKWAGYSSYTKYAKGVRGVQIVALFDDDPGEIKVRPQHNGGARTGFAMISGAETRIDYTGDAGEVGAAVARALERATL